MNNPSDGAGLPAEDEELGMCKPITRRDFVNSVAVGCGAVLLGHVSPGIAQHEVGNEPSHPWTGYSGVGDSAISNGNTWDVMSAGHGIRDALYAHQITNAQVTGESYDLVICGGGIAGATAAHTFLKETNRKRPCLLLDNHPLIGGEAKRNVFLVRGHRLIGAQGSNETNVPTEGWISKLWRDIGLPTQF